MQTVTIQKVKTVEKDRGRNLFVLLEDNSFPMVEVDYIDVKKDSLVFFLPAGALIPLRIAEMTKLTRTKATEDRDHEGFTRLLDDAIIPVNTLYPTSPRRPGTKDRLDLSKIDGEDYAWLIGIKFHDPLYDEQDEDEFGLDDDGFVDIDLQDVVNYPNDLPAEERELLDVIALTSEALSDLKEEDEALFKDVLDKLESDDD